MNEDCDAGKRTNDPGVQVAAKAAAVMQPPVIVWNSLVVHGRAVGTPVGLVVDGVAVIGAEVDGAPVVVTGGVSIGLLVTVVSGAAVEGVTTGAKVVGLLTVSVGITESATS
jgi:hypothetical protein